MTLRDTLEKIKAAAAVRLSEDTKEAMRRATRQLAESGQVGKNLGPGEKMPSFTVNNIDGQIIRSDDLISQAPLVMQFYRGYW